jgi:hypothetical protein
MPNFSQILLLSSILVSTYVRADNTKDEIDKNLIQWEMYGEYIGKHGCKKPVRVTTEPIINKYDPKLIDKLKTVFCTDWEIRYYVAAEKTILQSILLISGSANLPNGVKLGMAKENVIEVLGIPHESSSNSICYWTPENEAGGSDEIEFIFKKNKLHQVAWKYYID